MNRLITALTGDFLMTTSAPRQTLRRHVFRRQLHDEVVGKGAEPEAGQTVQVHYTGWLYDGQKGAKFDSSRDRGAPFTFVLGAGQVIAGWDLGVATMRVGGKRTLIIPPEQAMARVAREG